MGRVLVRNLLLSFYMMELLGRSNYDSTRYPTDSNIYIYSISDSFVADCLRIRLVETAEGRDDYGLFLVPFLTSAI